MAKRMLFQRKLAREARRTPMDSDTPREIPHTDIPPALSETGHAAKSEPAAPEPVVGPPIKAQISDLVKASKYRIPGQGAGPQEESFDAFRQRALPAIRAAMQDLAHEPASQIAIVLHPQTIRLLQSWIAAGMPDDYSVSPEAMGGGKEAVGAVERLYPVREDPGWKIDPVDMGGNGELPPGSIYLVQHGMSASAGEGYQKAGHKQNAMAEMVKHIKSGDFRRAQVFARKAADEHGMGEDEIGNMIDKALPSPKEARNLPNHHLLAVASAAGPSRRNEYSKIVRERFGDLSGASPDAQRELQAHLAQLGV